MSESKPDGFLTDDEYRTAYGLVPRLCVDLVIQSDKGVLLVRRKQQPDLGMWHLPGGRVCKWETLAKAARRIAADELGAEITIGQSAGAIEFLNERADLGHFHSVCIPTLCTLQKPDTPPDAAWFTHVPQEPMQAEQLSFLRAHGLLKEGKAA